MANTNSHETPPEIREPILREPDALVESIYALPGTDQMPDLESQDVMGEFLIDRFTPEEGPRHRVVLRPSGVSLPGIEREPAGLKVVSRLRKTKEWLIHPRTAAAIVIGSLALFNGIGNRESIGGSAEYVGHKIYRMFEPVKDKKVTETQTVVRPGRVRTISVTTATSNRVGASSIDPIVIHQFIDDVERAEQHGAKLLDITLVGNTSDEWGSDSSIGVSDSQNTQLGMARTEAAREALAAEGLSIDKSKLTLKTREHVIDPEQKAELNSSAHADGFSSIKEAIQAVDNGEKVETSFAQKIKRLFTGKDNRGVSLSASVEYPRKDTITHTKVERKIAGKDNSPKVPKPGFYGLIPMLPIRRRERYDKVKQLHHWKFTPSKPLYVPEIMTEELDQAWVRIRPEAEKADGTLVENPWAYTRKYEHLLRDGRITDMLRADFKNAKGEDKSLRIMFVDHSPDDGTIYAFEDLLHSFAAMEDGKLGSRVSGIFVYPSENAGTEHQDPKRIAMGLDKQSQIEIMGTYTYILDLVELHMPTTWDPEELRELMEDFNGPAWVTAHEVAGHGTDESDEQLSLRRVRTLNIPNARLIKGEPRALKMSGLDKILDKLPRPWHKRHEPIEFDITYPVVDNAGEVVTVRARVLEGDPRLAHATTSTIVGYRPTRYASTTASEHYAETAASVTTGIPVPFNEADVNVVTLRRDSGTEAAFATGYRPDKRSQRLFTRSVGAIGNSFPVRFRNMPEVTITHTNPSDDPVIRRELARTSRLRSLRPEQMVAILARIARSERRKTE